MTGRARARIISLISDLVDLVDNQLELDSGRKTIITNTTIYGCILSDVLSVGRGQSKDYGLFVRVSKCQNMQLGCWGKLGKG